MDPFKDLKPRPFPYCWATWITGLLTGSERCYWKVWLKAHYYLPKREDTGRDDYLKKWTEEHDKMTANRVQQLRAEGYAVTTEDDNSFILRGEVANLAGKPDIMAINHEQKTILIVDEKSGKQKDQYVWQLLIYMFAKAFNFPDYILSGEIEYKNERIAVHPRQLNAENKRRISSVMKIVGGQVEPPRIPSKMECDYCDIQSCPDRYSVQVTDVRAHF